ncbi:MAG: hypothetical protein ACJ8EB_06805, partial [Allosphingosinicella sp.]
MASVVRSGSRLKISRLNEADTQAGASSAPPSSGGYVSAPAETFVRAAAVTTNHTPTATAHSQTAAPGTVIPLTTLFSYSDADGLSDIVYFDVRDSTTGGGHLQHNGVAWADGQLTPDQAIGTISQWSYVVGPSGSVDSIGFNVTDKAGTFNPTVTATVTSAAANHTPTASPHNQTAAPGTVIPLSTLFTYSDADGSSDIVSFDVRDATIGGGYLQHNGVAWADGQLTPDEPISSISQWSFVVGPNGSVDSIGFNVTDKAGAFNPTVTATVTSAATNHTPTASPHNQTAAPGTVIPLSTLFTFSDADGSSDIVSFDVRDATSGGGHLEHNGVAWADGQLTPDQAIGTISQWSYVVGPSGSVDTIGFNVTDKAGAFNPTVTATVTAAATATNHTPTATGHDQSVAPGTVIALSTLFTYADADGLSDIVSFDVRDSTVGGGHLQHNGTAWPDGNLTPDQPIGTIGEWSYVVGPSGSVDSIGFNVTDKAGAFNATVTAAVTATTAAVNHAPTASAHSQAVAPGTVIPLSTLFTYADPDGLSDLVSFDVQDRTTGGGYLTKDGISQAASTVFERPIGEISHWAFVVGSAGYDSIGFNVVDKAGAFNPSVVATASAQTASNHPPAAIGTSKSVAPGTSIPLSQLFAFSDADSGDSVTAFAVKDRTIGGGHLTLNGVAQPENVLFDNIPLSQIGQWAFVAGAGASTDTIGFNAYDSYGAYSPSATTTVASQAGSNHAPVAVAHNQTPVAATSIPLSSLFTFSDADNGDSVTAFSVRDRSVGGGYLTRDGIQQADNQLFDNIPISEIGRWAFKSGGAGFQDLIGFNAIDSKNTYSTSSVASVTVAATATSGNHAPSISGPTVIDLNANTPVQIGSRFQPSDADGSQDVDHVTFFDSREGTGHITFKGQAISANQISVSVSDLQYVGYDPGSHGGFNKIEVQAFDKSGAQSKGIELAITVHGETVPIDADLLPDRSSLQGMPLTADKIVAAARLFADAGVDWSKYVNDPEADGIAWHARNCTGLVWAITYLAGASFYDPKDHTALPGGDLSHVNDPPGGAYSYIVPRAGNISQYNGLNGWTLVQTTLSNWQSLL